MAPKASRKRPAAAVTEGSKKCGRSTCASNVSQEHMTGDGPAVFRNTSSNLAQIEVAAERAIENADRRAEAAESKLAVVSEQLLNAIEIVEGTAERAISKANERVEAAELKLTTVSKELAIALERAARAEGLTAHGVAESNQENVKSCLQHAVDVKTRAALSDAQFKMAAMLASWIYDATDKEAGLPPQFPETCKVMHLTKQEAQLGNLSTFAVVATSCGIYIVWRGTVSSIDFLSDTSILPAPWQNGINVHSGIYALLSRDLARYRSELDSIIKHMAQKKKDGTDQLIFCGHSLGGGVAQLAALRCRYPSADRWLTEDITSVIDNVYAITFAAPMVVSTEILPGGQKPKEIMEWARQHCFNFVHQNDVIPRLPGHVQYLVDNMRSFSRMIRPFGRMLSVVFASVADAQLVEAVRWIGGHVIDEIIGGTADDVVNHKLAALTSVCINYQHMCTVLKLGECSVHNLQPEDLSAFNSNWDAINDGGTLLKDHKMGAYVSNLMDVAEIKADARDEMFKIAKFWPERTDSWGSFLGLAPKYKAETLQIQPVNINMTRMRSECAPDQMAKVVTFNGNSTNGKSYLMKHLLLCGNKAVRRVPFSYEPGEIENGATSCDCTLWKDDTCYFMDCEGTNGTDQPAALSHKCRQVLSGNKVPTRANIVKKTLPPFSLVTCNVFCYVVKENAAQNVAALNDVLCYTENAWQLISNAMRPVLIVIENEVSANPKFLKTIEKASEQFRAKDTAGKLKEYFLEVYLVQIPLNDHGTLHRLAGGGYFSAAEKFKERIAELRALIDQSIDVTSKKREVDGQAIEMRHWFDFSTEILRALGSGTPISSSLVRNRVRRPGTDGELFKDVADVFRFMMSGPTLSFSSVDELKTRITCAIKVARSQAARIIASVPWRIEPTLQNLESAFGTPLHQLASNISSALPCIACSASKDAKNRVCGQPKDCHEMHRSFYKEKKERESSLMKKLFGATFLEAKVWEGAHETVDFQVNDDFVKPAIQEALEQIQRLKSPDGGKKQRDMELLENLPKEYVELLPNDHLKVSCLNNRRCFVCCEVRGAGQNIFGLRNMAHTGRILGKAKQLYLCSECVEPRRPKYEEEFNPGSDSEKISETDSE